MAGEYVEEIVRPYPDSNVYGDLAFWEMLMPFHHIASFMTAGR